MRDIDKLTQRNFEKVFLQNYANARINPHNATHTKIVDMFIKATTDYFNENMACFVGIENAYQTIYENTKNHLQRKMALNEDFAILILELYSNPLYATIRTVYKSLI